MPNKTNNYESLIHKTLKLNLSKISLPPTLFLIVVLLALVLLLNVVSSFQKISQQSKALTCSADQCATSTGCQARGFRQNGYVCIGNNQWQGPDGSIINELPVVPPQPEITPGSQFARDIHGCIFSLRYDRDDQADSALKSQALTALQEIRNEILSGAPAQSVSNKVTTGVIAPPDDPTAERQRLFEIRRSQGSLAAQQSNPYDIFNIDNSPNFCFNNSDQLNQKFSEIFYENNPEFTSLTNALSAGEVSQPFVIYRRTTTDLADYAYMLVARTQ